jgi:hypothetical protein
VHLKFSKPIAFAPEPNNCHRNVWCQIRHAGGGARHGWVLAQDKAQSFAEAIFHTVWQSPDGRLVDITPRKDLEKRLPFAPDDTRQIVLAEHEGKPAIHTFDNVRMFQDRSVTPLKKITAVMLDGFAQRHGLWPWWAFEEGQLSWFASLDHLGSVG